MQHCIGVIDDCSHLTVVSCLKPFCMLSQWDERVPETQDLSQRVGVLLLLLKLFFLWTQCIVATGITMCCCWSAAHKARLGVCTSEMQIELPFAGVQWIGRAAGVPSVWRRCHSTPQWALWSICCAAEIWLVIWNKCCIEILV